MTQPARSPLPLLTDVSMNDVAYVSDMDEHDH